MVYNTAYSLYIADKFYTFVLFSTFEKTILSEKMIIKIK